MLLVSTVVSFLVGVVHSLSTNQAGKASACSSQMHICLLETLFSEGWSVDAGYVTSPASGHRCTTVTILPD
ncbi:hypothetical protein T4B_7185 [Trichinella pseudospiralis]|uniref:Secreted protein n=1 Tax=Trichinella pseudospiralis TaxID=6337 RepID=A0A0V1JNQ6_TRIPS|nr:hypothetical protein T4B_7185 [Trichinella pseudospiralis]KRZ36541.1 hypothetical protein T4C_4425 [Trichinella pseudospiralis]